MMCFINSKYNIMTHRQGLHSYVRYILTQIDRLFPRSCSTFAGGKWNWWLGLMMEASLYEITSQTLMADRTGSRLPLTCTSTLYWYLLAIFSEPRTKIPLVVDPVLRSICNTINSCWYAYIMCTILGDSMFHMNSPNISWKLSGWLFLKKRKFAQLLNVYNSYNEKIKNI